MRKALNENKKVQAGVIVVLAILGVFMFMRMSGGTETGTSAGQPAPATGTGAGAVPADGTTPPAVAPPAVGAPVTGATAATGTGASLPAAPAASATTVTPQALVPGPGLPADVAQAFARGDAVVLLIEKPGSTDDDLVRRAVRGVSRPGVSVFVAPASKVARYSRITQGVGLSRVPALIVVRPRKVGGDAPQAMVSYGFRSAQSVVQAVRDALYDGSDDVPYHPG